MSIPTVSCRTWKCLVHSYIPNMKYSKLPNSKQKIETLIIFQNMKSPLTLPMSFPYIHVPRHKLLNYTSTFLHFQTYTSYVKHIHYKKTHLLFISLPAPSSSVTMWSDIECTIISKWWTHHQRVSLTNSTPGTRGREFLRRSRGA